MRTTIKGDLNHVTAEGYFLGDMRMADGPVKVRDAVTILDLFGEGMQLGLVTEVTPDDEVIVDLRSHDSVLTVESGDKGFVFSNNTASTRSSSIEVSALRVPQLI